MAKIDENFQYDAYRFLIQGIRDADTSGILERWMGGVQTEFERTHGRIQEIPTLLRPLEAPAEALQYLEWIVGFSNESGLSWTNDINDTTRRKLIRNAVSLWKGKGTKKNLLDFLRAFTGRKAIIRDWFFHRMLIDEADILSGGGTGDPWIYGGKYSVKDENLSFILINRGGIASDERRLIYELFTYIHPTSAHFAVVYCAFVDNFSEELDLWTDSSTGSASASVDSSGRLVLGSTTGSDRAAVTPILPDDEVPSWVRVITMLSLEFESTSSSDSITINIGRGATEALGSGYTATLDASGGWSLDHSTLGNLASGSYDLPSSGTKIMFELEVEPLNAGQAELVVYVEHIEVAREMLTGSDIIGDLGTGLTLYSAAAAPNDVLVDYVQTLSDPFHVQFIGQSTTKETNWIADPDPGLEPFSTE